MLFLLQTNAHPREEDLLFSFVYHLVHNSEPSPNFFTSKTVHPYFNSLPHAEVDGLLRTAQAIQKHFNSLPHAEVDECSPGRYHRNLLFQLTTSRRGRLKSGKHTIIHGIFQLTTSRRGEQNSQSHSISTHYLTQR